LHANGIDVTGEYGDIGGWAPQLLAQGHAVMVFENDVERALPIAPTD
jgi:hypothetical protein